MKSVGLLVLWLVGSGLAISVAWAGVQVVDDQVIDPAPASNLSSAVAESDTSNPAGQAESSAGLAGPASGAQLPASARNGAAPSESADSDEGASSNLTSPSSSASNESSSTVAGVTIAQEPTTSVAARTTNQSSTTTPTTTTSSSTTSTPTTTATTPPTTAATTSTTGSSSGQVLTFHLIGGKTAISFSAASVQVLWATPNPGFEVRVEPESPGIKVEFRADHHRSRIDAWWDGGPQHEIREEPD